jgi:4-azaleucine resistance transporter AzlC
MATSLPFTRAGLFLGARCSVPVALSAGAYGIVFGVLSRQVGLSLGEATLMSGMVFAGSAQLVALGIWATPLPAVALVVTTLIVNLRHLLMGAALRPCMATVPRFRRYLSLFFMTDETWALTLRASQQEGFDGAFLLGSGLTLFTAWVGATILGHSVGAVIGDPAQWGLDFAGPAVFTALLTARWKGRADLIPWLTAAAVAVLVHDLVPGTWYILVGGLAGSATGAFRFAR